MDSQLLASFDKSSFLLNFSGIEDVAQNAIENFLATLPELQNSVFKSIQSKNSSELELTAHTLKGVVSNFYAEPSRLLALKLEILGKQNNLSEANYIYSMLTIELSRLSEDLSSLASALKKVS